MAKDKSYTKFPTLKEAMDYVVLMDYKTVLEYRIVYVQPTTEADNGIIKIKEPEHWKLTRLVMHHSLFGKPKWIVV